MSLQVYVPSLTLLGMGRKGLHCPLPPYQVIIHFVELLDKYKLIWVSVAGLSTGFDISKVFDRVSHGGLLNKFRSFAIYADDTTLYPKCDQASDLCQQLELASELESDLQDTVDWGRK